MKRFIQMLSLAVLLAVSLASCSATRKVESEQTQQNVTATISTDTQTQTQTNDAVGVRIHEIDLSNAVIEFTKVEYADCTEVVSTGADVSEAVKQRDREETEPPNSTHKVKSVTKGRVILHNDKTKQTETNVEHNEVSQTDKSVNSDVVADIETSVKSEDKPKRGFFYNIGIIATVIIVLFAGGCIAYAVWRIRK